MIDLKNFRVVKLDSWNWTFEQFREIKSKDKTQPTKIDWVRVGGYYGNMKQCLNALKDYIINDDVNKNDYDTESLIEKINMLNNSYVNCKILVKE